VEQKYERAAAFLDAGKAQPVRANFEHVERLTRTGA
jgi:hypothetical protein